MVGKGLDPAVISKFTSHQVEQVTCIECCKYYIAPETAACGHTLCHSCWKGRRVCYSCAASIDRKTLRLNLPLQTLTQHVHALAEAFEKLFNVKLDEFTLDILDDLQSEDPTKHVKEWLANSENQFSAPALNSQMSDPEHVKQTESSKAKIQIHTNSNKTESAEKVVKTQEAQEDWDKIEVLPDKEEVSEKPKEHVVGPMDFEPFFVAENEYTDNNPRRSSRKRELKADSNPPTTDLSIDKNSTKISSTGTGTKSLKNKQTWNSVKKMRKEFSKLNKKNKSKLNVSIEMCKKAQNTVSKPKQVQTFLENNSEQINIIIDDTPKVDSKQNDKKENKINGNIPEHTSTEEELPEVFDKRNTVAPSNNNTSEDIPEKNADVDISIENNENQNNKLILCNKSSPYHTNGNVPFIKKSTLPQKILSGEDNVVQITQKEVETDTIGTNTDDIEISIKMGNTVTNIVIKNKRKDVEIKVNADKEIQTCLGPYTLVDKNDAGCSPMTGSQQNIGDNNKESNKTHSTKKNTASADTAPVTTTAPFEITDSIERELSDVMEHLEHKRNKSGLSQKTSQVTKAHVKHSQVFPEKNHNSVVIECQEDNNGNNRQVQKPSAEMSVIESLEMNVDNEVTRKNINEIPKDMEDLNDVDIFNSGSIKEANVKLLKDAKINSEILISTVKSKKTRKVLDNKRVGNDDIELPCSKKQRIDLDSITDNNEENPQVPAEQQNDSVPMNYDVILSQVFANIDADIHNENNIGKTQTLKQKMNESQKHKQDTQFQTSQIIPKTQNKIFQKEDNKNCSKNKDNQKYSENVFSVMEKDSQPHSINISGQNFHKLPGSITTQQRIENLLTPGMCRDLAASRETDTQMDKNADASELIHEIHSTPVVDNDDSESVVEETPQKNISFSKTKQNDTVKNTVENQKAVEAAATDSQIIRSIINISDTTMESTKVNNATVVDVATKKVSLLTKDQVLETPLTINKFVNHIKHNSTPVAKKSLNFDSEQDLEETICPTTTQEKEFLSEAFKHTQISPIKRALTLKNIFNKPSKKFFIAGSCLSPAESKNLKMLCIERGWTYLDKYTKDLTHLVVGVDEENKSQRSVKYMCALAASKWIVTFAWVEKCLLAKSAADELPYEPLDACGEPGPRRSRTAIKKVFKDVTFYCMPPFSLLEIETLKQMLEAAGGRVVDDPTEVKVTPENCSRPALLLAEPENTQEDRFVYFAMEHKVVPVNYEWALNCLGCYSLCSIHELLLCPFSILPPYIRNWPAALIQLESEEEE